MTSNINIRHEMNLAAYGTHRNGNCEPVVCIELQKTFSSIKDAAEFFSVHPNRIWGALNGFTETVGLWERDENGKKIRKICKCHFKYARDMEEAADALMAHGRQMMVDNAVLKKENSDLQKANENLKHQLSEKDELHIACKQLFNDKELLTKAKAEVARLEALVAEDEKRIALMV